MADIDAIAGINVHTQRMEDFLKGISLLKQELNGEVPIACEYISPFTIATRLRGTTAIMEDFYDNPELLRALQETLVPLDIEIGRALIEAGVEYIFYGADMEKARSMTGYIFSTSGTTSPVTPRENFEAMNREVLLFKS